MAENFYNTQLNQLPGAKPAMPYYSQNTAGSIQDLLKNVDMSNRVTTPYQGLPKPMDYRESGYTFKAPQHNQGAGLNNMFSPRGNSGGGTSALEDLINQLMQNKQSNVGGATPGRPPANYQTKY